MNIQTTRRSRSQGFALIVTLSLMILLTVVAVGLLTLSSISLRSSSQGSAISSARANARIALMLAIGDLQKFAGPDQRISARADILDDKIANPRLTGVWRSWEIKATSPPSPADYATTSRNDKFLGWLTSATDGKAAAAIGYANATMPTDATKSVLLWGEKSFGRSPVPAADLVRAEKIPTSGTGSSKGALAWAVMDEGIKVRINTPQHSTAGTVGEKIARLGAGQRPKSESLAALTGIEPGAFELDSSEFGSIRKGITRLNMSLAFEQLAAGAGEALAPLFHDVSGVSQGLFVDVARGGLKRDFQLMTNSDALPPLLSGKGVYESMLDLKGAEIKSDPTWASLSDFARIYQSDGLSNTAGPLLKTRWPTGWQVAVVAKNATTNLVTLKNLNPAPPPGIVIAPVIEKVQMLFSLVGRELYDSNGNSIHSPQGPNWKGTPYIYELGLLFTPIVTLRNPYNTTLEINNATVELVDVPFAMKVYRSGIAMSPTLVPFSAMAVDNSDGKSRKFFGMRLRNRTASNSPASAAGLQLLPGEVKIFSPYIAPTWTWLQEQKASISDRKMTDLFVDSSRSRDKTSSIDAIAGWQGNGIGFHRDWLTGPHEVTNNSQGRWRACFGVRANDAISVEFAPKGIKPPAGETSARFTVTLSATTTASASSTRAIISALEVKYGDENGLTKAMLGSNGATLKYPKDGGTVNGGDLVDSMNTQIKSLARVKPMALFSIQSKATSGARPGSEDQDGRLATKPWSFGHSNIAFSSIDVTSDHMANQSHEVDLQVLSVAQGTLDRLPITPQDRGVSISGQTALTGANFGIQYEVPLAPLQNLTGLNGANPGGSSGYLPRFAQPIGNSWASPMIPSDAIRAAGNGYAHLDHSFLLNLALYDSFYFSGLADRGSKFGNGGKTSTLAQSFADGENLEDPRLEYYQPKGSIRSDLEGVVAAADGYSKLAAWQMMNGAFNANSTSVKAWKAMLASIHDKDSLINSLSNGTTSGSNGKTTLSPLPAVDSDETRISRFRLPAEGPSPSLNPLKERYWMGSRAYSEAQLQTLAEKIVDQVRARGPFLSMADFVNRQLGSANSSDSPSLRGALQQAIDESDLNMDAAAAANAGYDISESQVTGYGFMNPKAGAGPSYQGAPGNLSQADLLNVLGNAATVRSDTFTIRGYGEARDAQGKAIASATCEAIVQRRPDYVDPSEEADVSFPSLVNPQNIAFGRRFEIISFRWLNEGGI